MLSGQEFDLTAQRVCTRTKSPRKIYQVNSCQPHLFRMNKHSHIALLMVNNSEDTLRSDPEPERCSCWLIMMHQFVEHFCASPIRILEHTHNRSNSHVLSLEEFSEKLVGGMVQVVWFAKTVPLPSGSHMETSCCAVHRKI